jgi:hypothetical protein
VTTAVEGDIALNGPTQVEMGSGVIVREKVSPVLDAANGVYQVNYVTGGTPFIPGYLKNRVSKIYNVYKFKDVDTKWTINVNAVAQGSFPKAYIKTSDFDSTAEYYVSYLAYDKQLLTNNGTEFKTSYDSSLKSVVDNLTEKQADLSTIASVNVQAIAELYKRVKALGG